MPRQLSYRKLIADFDYYCSSLLVVKPKAAALCRLQLNPVQQMLYYGIPPELRKGDRRFDFLILDRGWREYEEQGLPLRQYILKARQMGMSTYCVSWVFHKAHTRPGTNSVIVAQDDDATTGLFQMARTFYSYLPEALRPQIRNSNARELAFQDPNGSGGLNSWIKTQTAGNKNIGRSKTIHHLHCSEFSFWVNPEAVLDGLFEAVPDQPGTSIVIETTAEGLGSLAYNAWLTAKEAREAREPGALDPVFIPWFILPEYSLKIPAGYQFSPEDKDFKDEYGITWEQVCWYKQKLRSFELRHPGRGSNYMKTEYPSNDFEPWQAAGQSAFPDVIVDMIYKYQVKDPEGRFSVVGGKIIADPNGKLRVWERQRAGVQYAIGVDTAHGVGQDYSVISVLAHPGYRQVAEWSSNQIGPKDLAKVIEAIARYYNEAVVAVEVNGASGMLANSTLYDLYSNVYRWEYFDKQKQAETTKLGWETTARTKELLIDHANSLYVPDVKCVIRSENVAAEMRLLRMSPLAGSGMTQYAFLNHTGDHLMAWLIAAMCLWRKIARYDIGSEDVTHERLDHTGEEHLYDVKVDEIINGTLPRDEFYGGYASSDGWMYQ